MGYLKKKRYGEYIINHHLIKHRITKTQAKKKIAKKEKMGCFSSSK